MHHFVHDDAVVVQGRATPIGQIGRHEVGQADLQHQVVAAALAVESGYLHIGGDATGVVGETGVFDL